MLRICPSQCGDILKKKNTVILDIREKFEYDAYHIKSIHIPMANVSEHLEELKKYNQVIVTCQSGRRAEALVNYLETDYGFTNLILMEGGLLSWQEKVDKSLSTE